MPNKFSEFIRAKRGNMSLREFAKLCGNLSHTQIDSIEKGFDPRTSKPVSPTIDTLNKIAKGIGVSVSYLAALAVNEPYSDPLRLTLLEKKRITKCRQLSPDDVEDIDEMIDFKLEKALRKERAIQNAVI